MCHLIRFLLACLKDFRNDLLAGIGLGECGLPNHEAELWPELSSSPFPLPDCLAAHPDIVKPANLTFLRPRDVSFELSSS